jgi:hypothetical protein
MTVITPQPLINCENASLDCCDIFKQMAIIDSVGNVYLRIWAYNCGGDGGGGHEPYNGTFVNADLQTETLTIGGVPDDYVVFKAIHNLNTLAPGLTVIDNDSVQVTVTQYIIDANQSWIILGGLGTTITGTYQFQFV